MITASPIWGIVSMIALVLLSVSGVPIAAAMGIVGSIFIWLYYGSILSVDLVTLTSWFFAASYVLTLIPLFVLMGEIASQCGIGRDAFSSFYKWLSKVRGSLAIVSTSSCAIFGTITGSTAAAIATIGGIACPEMKKRGYSVPLALGSIAVSGILATLIPPSNMAVFYGVLTEVSIGKLFIAGFIPGLILMILFNLTTFIWVSLKPSIAPRGGGSFSLKEKIASLKGVVPLLIIFVVMIGGIYTGTFSPTEAGGVGAIYTIVLTLILRRLTWQRFKAALRNTVRITTFIMFLVMGAMVFSTSMALSRLPQSVTEMVVVSGISPLHFTLSVIALFLLFGCFLDSYGLMVLFVPLLYPAVIGLGLDLIWFGTLVIVLLELALITPPVAAHIYIAQSLDPEATTMEVIRGVIPYYAGGLTLVLLLVLFPQIALWLPGHM